MSATDYIIDIALIAVVLRQIRARQLTLQSIMFPVVLVAIAGADYLRGFPTAGNDLLMILILIAAGAIFGVVSGLATHVWESDGKVYAKAGTLAAAVWILGMGIRMGFDVWANSRGGERHLFQFSIQHSITSAEAFMTAFVLMAFAQVFVRVGILQLRRVQLERQIATVPSASAQ